MVLVSKINCSSCNVQFMIKDFTCKNAKCPYLLQCGHSICEACILQKLKLSNSLICKLCDSVSSFELNKECSDSWPLDLYALGNLAAAQKLEKNKKILFLSSGITNFNYTVKNKSESNSNKVICEECSGVACWNCENCETNFCEYCWLKVHTSARSLMRHVKQPVSSKENLQNRIKKCSIHQNQILEFYCKTCCEAACSHCMIIKHHGEGHSPVSIQEQNINMTKDIKIAAKEAEEIRKRMIHTLEKIKLALLPDSEETSRYSTLEANITRNFFRLHGILQLEEERMLKKLKEASSSRGKHLKSLSEQLNSQIDEVQLFLREYDLGVKQPAVCDLIDLHEKLLSVKKYPCHLISPKNTEREIKVEFDDSLIDLIRTYCTVKFPSINDFELKSNYDLPEDFVVDPLKIESSHKEENDEALSEKSEKDHINNDCFSDSSSKDTQKSDFERMGRIGVQKSALTSKTFFESKIYSVRVTYIKNPGEFYVISNFLWGKQRMIDKKASKLASDISTHPKSVMKDEIYLVKYQADGKWYRARIVEVLPKNSKDEELVTVYYLDYGNTEEVSLQRLRAAPPELTEDPPLAIKCRLFDCIPKHGEWCVESTEAMGAMLENSTVTMFVMKVQPDCLEVDLSKVCPKNQMGTEIMSVRDALVFLEFTCLVGGTKKSWHLKNSLSYLNQSFSFAGDEYPVLVTHVNSPFDFYVQNEKLNASFAQTLSSEMQNYYSSNSHKGILYNPVLGMPCAALFSTKKKWLRAKIEEIPAPKFLTVFSVDYGIVETLPWTSVRRIKENFIKKRPPLALHCSLAEIQSADSDFWNVSATNFLKKLQHQKGYYMKVQEVNKNKQILEVSFFKKFGNEKKFVNFSLLCLDDALTMDSDLTVPNSPNRNSGCWNSDFVKNEEKGRRKNKLSAKKLRELHAFEKQDDLFLKTTNKEPVVQAEINSCDNSYKTKVEVLSAESPSIIYVTFPALKDVLSVLETKLLEFYKNSKPPEIDWIVDTKCAVFSSTYKKWYRATVLEILPNEKAKVFLKDIAEISTEPISTLRVLDQSFLKYATCAVQCHLSGIQPAGDSWPGVSCEFLANELECFKEIYMTRKGEIKEKSLPVELWVQKIVPGTALEPAIKEWITLNRLLVDQGLAIPEISKSICSHFANDKESLKNDFEVDVKNAKESDGASDCLSEKSKDSEVAFSNFQWLPPSKTEKIYFIGMPTFIDCNGYIYLYDVDKEEELTRIRHALVDEFENSEPGPEDNFWTEGQPCAVKYHVDNFWYRGMVTQVNTNSTYEVLFVDYGNIETCESFEMRKKIRMADVPVLTQKFQLHGIAPKSSNGKWPMSVIDILHVAVVDKHCKVNVIRNFSDVSKPSTISLKILNNDIDIATFLVNQKLARFTPKEYVNDKEESEEFEEYEEYEELEECEESEEPLVFSSFNKCKNNFSPFQLPPNCNSFYLKISTIISETEFYGNIMNHGSLPENLRQVLNDFDSLQEKLQSSNQSPLKEFKKGQPCCCLYSEKRKWCRGEIESVKESDNSACVFYVDYGKKEYLKKELLHECPNDWLNVPKMAVKFRLTNVKKSPDASKSAYVTALAKCLNENSFFAEVVGNFEEVLEVRLLTKKNGPLAYQEMIDDALMCYQNYKTKVF